MRDKLMLLFLLSAVLPWWQSCRSQPVHVNGGRLVVETVDFAAKRVFYSETADAWGASNDFETIVVMPGQPLQRFPVGARGFAPRLSVQAGRLDLCEVYWRLGEEGRKITSTIWDGTGRAYYVQAAYPQYGETTIAFARFGFSKGLDTRYEPILEPEMVVLDGEGRLLRKLLPQFKMADRLSLAVGGDHLAAADYRQLYIWNWRTGALVHGVVLQENERFPVMAMRADGQQLALADADGGLHLLSGPDWTARPLAPPTAGRALQGMGFAPDGQTLHAVDGKTGLLAWGLAEDGAPAVLYPGAFGALAIAPDGRNVLLADSVQVRVVQR